MLFACIKLRSTNRRTTLPATEGRRASGGSRKGNEGNRIMRYRGWFQMLVVAVSIAIGWPQLAVAQSGDAPKQTVEERLQALEEEVKRLRGVEQELIELKKQRVADKESGAATAQKAQAVEQDLNALKQQRELDQGAQAAAAQKLKDFPTITAGSEGFALKS